MDMEFFLRSLLICVTCRILVSRCRIDFSALDCYGERSFLRSPPAPHQQVFTLDICLSYPVGCPYNGVVKHPIMEGGEIMEKSLSELAVELRSQALGTLDEIEEQERQDHIRAKRLKVLQFEKTALPFALTAAGGYFLCSAKNSQDSRLRTHNQKSMVAASADGTEESMSRSGRSGWRCAASPRSDRTCVQYGCGARTGRGRRQSISCGGHSPGSPGGRCPGAAVSALQPVAFVALIREEGLSRSQRR